MDAKRPMTRHIVIKMQKVVDEDRILKAARENHLQGNSHKTVGGFLNRNFAG